MLDQNTTAVLTTLITVLGTLGGVVLGVVLSNRYVARQEKAKRNIPIIEETYTLVNKIDDQIDECLRENKLLIGNMKDMNDRVRTLIYLYLRSIKKEYNEYGKTYWELMNLLREKEGRYHERNENSMPIEENWCYARYRKNFVNLLESLEKLVD